MLDLRHRLTQCWMVFLSGDCDAWLVRKVAAMSRRLTRQQIALVDTAVSEALPGESPGRVLRIAEAKVIEADPESHRARLEDELRAVAFGWLAHPAEVAELLASQPAPKRPRPKVAFYLHLHQAALEGTPAVARAEQLGPMLLDQVRRFLGHADVDLHPVIDLTTGASVNCYEHPTAMTERGRLRNPGEVFPHAARSSRSTDSDHPDPYQANGPPGQTRDTNHAPLSRTNHRAKTHLGYRLRQRSFDTYDWATPHGLHRRVDRTGTHELDDTTRYAESLEAAIQRLADEHGR